MHKCQLPQGALYLREKFRPRNFRLRRQGHKVATGFFVYNAVEVFLRRWPQNPENQVELIQIVFPRENRPIREHFREDASNSPDVYALCVAWNQEQWSSIVHPANRASSQSCIQPIAHPASHASSQLYNRSIERPASNQSRIKLFVHAVNRASSYCASN